MLQGPTKRTARTITSRTGVLIKISWVNAEFRSRLPEQDTSSLDSNNTRITRNLPRVRLYWAYGAAGGGGGGALCRGPFSCLSALEVKMRAVAFREVSSL